MKIKVEVTQEDINLGIPREAEKCPIALALKRQASYSEVDDFITIDINKIRYTADLPSIAAEFISKFDNQDPVLPFSFEIEVKEVNQDEDYENYEELNCD